MTYEEQRSAMLRQWDEAAYPFTPKVLLNIIRRVMPSIIAHDIIGVQPMIGPAGSIFGAKN